MTDYPEWAKNVPDLTDCPKCGRDSCDGTCEETKNESSTVNHIPR